MSILTLEVIEPFTTKEHGQVSAWQVGQRMALSQEKAQRVIECVGRKVRVVEHDRVDRAIGTVVRWGCERGLICDVIVDRAFRWLWVETATRAGWTRTAETTTCPRCRGVQWWWSKDAAIPCGFSHDWIARRDLETGEGRGPGHPANRDHLNECCRHRFRFVRSLALLCATCHPPMPSPEDWAAAWREIADLSAGIMVDDLRYAPLVGTLQQCDEAFRAGDYAGFQVGVMRVRRAAQGPTKFGARM